MLRLKVWLLNIKLISESDGLSECNHLHELWGQGITHYDYYKVFDNIPEHHMLYSIDYLNRTSVFKLLWKHYEWQGFFRRLYVNERW